MKILVHVERLVIDGLALEHRDAELVRAAVARELTRLFAGDPASAALVTGGSRSSVSAPAVRLRAGAAPAQLGGEIARSVHCGLSPVQAVPPPARVPG
jgi:hypothetical protein